MKKGICIIVLLAALAGFGLPYLNGMILEKALFQVKDRINKRYEESGSGIRMAIVSYDRGMWSSVIEWRLDPGSLSKWFRIDSVIGVETATHGYKGVISTTCLEKNKWFTDFLERHLNGKNPVSVNTVYPLKGDIVSTVTIERFLGDDGHFLGEVKPGQWVLTLDKELKHIESDFTWDGLYVPVMVKIGNVRMRSDLKNVTPLLWDGQSSFFLDFLKLRQDGRWIELKNLELKNRVDYDGERDRVSLGMGVGVGGLSRNGEKELEDAYLHMGINRLDAPGYEQVLRIYTAMANDLLTAVETDGLDVQQTEAFFKNQMAAQGFNIMAAAENLLKKDLEIKISDLTARLPDGQIEGGLTLALKKDMRLAEFIPVMMQPGRILDIFSLESSMNVPGRLIGQNPYLTRPIYPGMQTGLFVKAGEMLIHHAQTRDNRLFINQKEVVFE